LAYIQDTLLEARDRNKIQTFHNEEDEGYTGCNISPRSPATKTTGREQEGK
jgi:hypothetical protein